MGRIENHPILGPSPEGKMVKFFIIMGLQWKVLKESLSWPPLK